MCDNKACHRDAKYFVHINVTPQVLGDGTKEKSPAGRSNTVCARHLGWAIRNLTSLTYRISNSCRVTPIIS
jgi:hypothetical protein